MYRYIFLLMFIILFLVSGCSEKNEMEPIKSKEPVSVDEKNDFVEKDIAQSIRNELSDTDIVVSNCLMNGNEKYIFYCKTIEEETLKETIYQYSYEESDVWQKEEVSWGNVIKGKLAKGESLSFISYGLDMRLYALFQNNGNGLTYNLYKIDEETNEIDKVQLSCLGKQDNLESMPVYVGVFQSGNVLIQKANGEVEWYDPNTGEQKGFYSGMPHKLFMGRDNFYAVDKMNSQIVKVSEDSGKAVEIFSLEEEALLRSDSVGTELQVEVFENRDDDIFIMTPSGVFEVDEATKRRVKLISASESKAFSNAGNNTMGLLEKDGNIVLMSQEAVEEGIQLYAYEYVLGKQ